jgi:hypothetical protein
MALTLDTKPGSGRVFSWRDRSPPAGKLDWQSIDRGTRMYTTLKTAMVLSALWAGAAAAATPPALDLSEAELAAIEACFEVTDERASAQCLKALQLPLPPEMQRLVDLATDPDIEAASERWQQAADAAIRTHVDALAASATPRNLLAAVLLSRPEASDGDPDAIGTTDFTVALPEHAVGWFHSARDAVPADPLVAWWEATGCIAANLQCDRADATTRLLQVDADNAAVQLLALHAADSAGDVVAARTHLRLAAQAGRFEPYGLPLLQLILDEQSAVALPPLPVEVGEALGPAYGFAGPLTSEDFHAVEAMGQWAALPMQPLARLCGAGAGIEPGLRQDCVAVLEQMAGNPDMALYPSLALDLLVRLTADDPAGDFWRERLRGYSWLYEHVLALLGTGSGLSPSEQARLWAQAGELGAWRTLLDLNGIAAEPPADWLPADARKRALVTTGRAPPAG